MSTFISLRDTQTNIHAMWMALWTALSLQSCQTFDVDTVKRYKWFSHCWINFGIPSKCFVNTSQSSMEQKQDPRPLHCHIITASAERGTLITYILLRSSTLRISSNNQLIVLSIAQVFLKCYFFFCRWMQEVKILCLFSHISCLCSPSSVIWGQKHYKKRPKHLCEQSDAKDVTLFLQ